jgi:hypothetical protein
MENTYRPGRTSWDRIPGKESAHGRTVATAWMYPSEARPGVAMASAAGRIASKVLNIRTPGSAWGALLVAGVRPPPVESKLDRLTEYGDVVRRVRQRATTVKDRDEDAIRAR